MALSIFAAGMGLLPSTAQAACQNALDFTGKSVGDAVVLDVSTCVTDIRIGLYRDQGADSGNYPLDGLGGAVNPATLTATNGSVFTVTPAQLDSFGLVNSYSFRLDSLGGASTSGQITLYYAQTGLIANTAYVISLTNLPVAPAVTVSPASLPTLTAGTPFSQTLTSSGGTAPYVYTLQSGTLPVGLSLSSGGVLSGTPTQRGAYSLTVRSTDNILQFNDKAYTGTVADPTLSISPTVATAIQGVVFSQTVAATGGVAPHTFVLETGSFPAGISISSAGVISGTTAAAAGNYPVTLRVTDSSTGTGSYFELESFQLTVSPSPSVSIAVSPASVAEDGASNLIYTVTRSLNLSSPTVVNITTGGTATSGTDYTGAVTTVTIPGGATTATITINPTADTTVEPDETVILTVAAGTGYTVGAPASATGTILNDDVPTASISVSPASVAEDGATNLTYTVTLDQASASAVSVNFNISGTATSGTDYAAVTSPLVIPAGSMSGTITINPTADTTVEADETVIITLAAGTGYTVGAPASATGTILNDDLPNLTINDVTASEGNSGTTNFTFTVSLSAAAGPGGVNFDIATANGTATAGVDYVAKTLTSQTIPAGSSSYSFVVQVNGDALNEPSETFFVNVTNVTGAVVVDGQGLGTIVNDDPLPSLSINDVTLAEGNSGTTNAVFTVTLSAPSGQNVTVNYDTADGTATQPSDYTSTSGTLIFTPGQTTRTITVPVLGDVVPEANETFFVNLSGATNATISDNQGLGTITNDDVAVTVNTASLANGTVATAYSQTVTASGGTSPRTFAVTAGALPAGLTLSSGGSLTGTPTAGGTFSFTITATDSSPSPGPFTDSRAYVVTINAPTIVLAATPLAGGTLNSPYSATISAASGGTATYSYAQSAGTLPGGLNLNASTGAIGGTPSVLGSFSFDITATDSSTGTGPYFATQTYSISIISAPPVATSSALTVAYNAAATNVPLTLSGGAPTSVAIGTTPQHGTAIASGTTITYQPTAGYAGTDSFTYTATNTGGTSAPATVSVTVSDPVITITPSGSFAATVASPHSLTFTWNGGAQPCTNYQVTNLPAGLSITGTTANSVTVSGTPTQAGSFALNVSAADSSTGNGPYTVGQAFTMTVAAPTLVLSPPGTTFSAPYGAAYAQAFTASGGIGPYTYVRTGSLPAGLSFSGNTVSGSPTATGTFAFTITATDTGSTGAGAPFTVAKNYTVNVATPTISLSPTTLPNGTVAASYNQTITATGGVAPYTYTVSAGVLPTGLNLSTGGGLSGTLTAGGGFTFTLTATDANGQFGTRAYTVIPAAPTIVLPVASLPGGTAGLPYSSAIGAASGGIAPYAYAVTSGSLPAGLNLNVSTGAITGTPTAIGTSNFGITATDSSTGTGPYTATQNYSITMNQASTTTTVTSSANPSAFGQSVTFTATVASSVGTPTGTVTFKDGTTTLGTGTLASTTATFASSALGVGNHAITAVYGGDTNHATSTSTTLTQAVNQAGQVITFAKPADVTFTPNGTLALSATGGASGLPVTFASTSTGVCTTGGTNGATVTFVSPGNCTITASQAANVSYAAAADVTRTFAITQITTTTSLTSSANPVLLNQPFTLTASVTITGPPPANALAAVLSAFIAPVPVPLTGSVTFKNGATVICNNVALTAGAATCNTTVTTAGAQSFSATYSGGGATAQSTSNVVAQTVVDQAPKTAQVIAKFLGERNNQILSNGPSESRQIDRLIEAGGANGNSGGAPATALTDDPAGMARAPMASRLGDSPDVGVNPRLSFGAGLRTRGADLIGGPTAPDGNPFPMPAPLGGVYADQPQANGGAINVGPVRMRGSLDGAQNFGFSASLRDLYRYSAEQQAHKMRDGALGLGGAGPAIAQRFNPFDLWIEGKYASFSDNRASADLTGHFGILTLGADYVVNRALLVGTFVQFDSMAQRSDSKQTDVRGKGWMAGPYATVRLSENVFLQGRAAWGRSSNDVSPFQTYTDRFDSTRWLAAMTVTGNWTHGLWAFRPSASVSYIEDVSKAYADTFGVVVPSVKATLGQAKVGPEISYKYQYSRDIALEPHAGVQLIWNFAGGATVDGIGALGSDAAGPSGVRGRTEVGVRATTSSGVNFGVSGSYDGIGSPGYSAVSGKATVRVPLN